MGMGNLQKKVYKDRRTGVKRRWMEYWKVDRWLKVRDKTTDWGPVVVVFFSIILSLSFFGLAKINHETDAYTEMIDGDGDKQFDNPWAMNDGRFSFTFGETLDPNIPSQSCTIAVSYTHLRAHET